MSQFGTIYRGTFNNDDRSANAVVVSVKTTIDIILKSHIIDDAEVQNIIPLVLTGSPLTTSTKNNGKDVFAAIRSTEATIRVLTSQEVNIATFADSDGEEWLVKIYLNNDLTRMIFTGYLVESELEQSYLPDPNELILTASDNLGLLKDKPMVPGTDCYYSIIQYIVWALKETGLELDIFIVNNLRELSSSSDHIYLKAYLLKSTFEKQIGEYDDSYNVLEKILGEDCFVTQWRGAWYIQRVDELPNDYTLAAKFTYLGAFVAWVAAEFSTKRIGPVENMIFCNADQILQIGAKHSFTKEIFNYDYPPDIPENSNFKKGTWLSPLSVPPYLAYIPDKWQFLRYDANMSEIATGTNGYVRVLNDEWGKETERVLFIGKAATVGNVPYPNLRFRTLGCIPVEKQDKLILSFDVQYENLVLPGGAFAVAQAEIRLSAYDGTFWTLYAVSGGASDGYSKWFASNGLFTYNGAFVRWEGDTNNITFTEWNTINIESVEIPRSGLIEIHLVHDAESNNTTKLFSNLKMEYKPYINGSYYFYDGQYNKVTRLVNPAKFKESREKTVYLSDGPKPLIKGVMQKYVSGVWVKVESFAYHDGYIQITGTMNVTASFLVSPSRIDITTVETFVVGQKIRVTGSASNNGIYDITNVSYVIVGTTSLTVAQNLISEGPVNITIEILSGLPAYSDFKPWSRIQAESVWNQFRNPNRILTGSVKGIDSFDQSTIEDPIAHDYIGMMHKYFLSDPSAHSNNRYFALTDYEIDWRECIWKGTFIQILDTTIGKVYSDTWEFKHIQNG